MIISTPFEDVIEALDKWEAENTRYVLVYLAGIGESEAYLIANQDVLDWFAAPAHLPPGVSWVVDIIPGTNEEFSLTAGSSENDKLLAVNGMDEIDGYVDISYKYAMHAYAEVRERGGDIIEGCLY